MTVEKLANIIQVPSSSLELCSREQFLAKYNTSSVEAAYIMAEMNGTVFRLKDNYVIWRSSCKH